MMFGIPEQFHAAVRESQELRTLVDAAWAGQGWAPRSTLGERGDDYVWALRCLLGRLGSGLPKVGSWQVSKRTGDEVQQEVRLVRANPTPGVSHPIGSVTRSMWWPRIPLTRGEPVPGLVWQWQAAGRWGFTATRGQAKEVVDEVLMTSGWPLCTEER